MSEKIRHKRHKRHNPFIYWGCECDKSVTFVTFFESKTNSKMKNVTKSQKRHTLTV